jgi:small-conductance mechanosensitive channel
VLECNKSRQGIITVSCSDPRHGSTPPWSFRFDDDGRIVDADERRQQVLEQRRQQLLQQRQEAHVEKQKERLDYALRAIRDNGGSMSRKQLTEILAKKFELKRPTVASIISQWIKESLVYSVNDMIHASDETALAF